MKPINFNSNQFSYLSNEVRLAMDQANQILINHKPFSFGTDQKVAAETENVRNFVAGSLNLKPHEVFFSNGSSNSDIEIINNSILFLGIEDILTSKFENNRKLEYLSKLNESGKIKLHYIETSSFGEINLVALQNILSKTLPKTLISLSHANLYTGALLPIKEISGICKKNQACFHLDLGLTIGRYSIDLQNIKPDFASFDSSLLHGPIGIGIKILSDKIEIEHPIYHALASNFNNSGNKNLSHILGFHKAYSIALEQLDEDTQKITKLKSYFTEKLKSFPAFKPFNSETKKQGLINLIPLFIDKKIIGDYLVEKLDLKGISIQTLTYPIDLGIYKNHHFVNIALNEGVCEGDVDWFFEIMQRF